MGDITALLLEWNEGDEKARDALVSKVYEELRRMARRSLDGERREYTLQPTALVNEVYERLVNQDRVRWQNRAHFFAIAATLMRRVLLDRARRKKAARRGGDMARLGFAEGTERFSPGPDVDLIALDGALNELAQFDEGQARVVELRFFGGLAVEEVAEVLGISRATANRDWSMARAWLRTRLAAE